MDPPPIPPFQPRINSSPTPTPQLWSFLFFILQALSVIPSFLGFFYCVHRFYSISPPMLINSSSTWLQGGKAVGVSEARSTRLDWFIAGMWALACAYFSHSLAKGLLRRWLVYYSLLPTVIRVISLQAICWPLCLTTHRVLSFDQPVAAWMICASTAAISNVIQIWVTSNIVGRKDRRGHQRWQILSVIVSAVVGPAVHTEKYRKSERVLSWKRVLWGTVVPFAILGWITTSALLWQQFVARYKGYGGVGLGSIRLNHAVGPVRGGAGVSGLDRQADVRIVMLVTSSWTHRSTTNRQKFRQSTVFLIPPSSSALSITYRFLIGTAPSPQAAAKLGSSIEAEAAEYGDMLMVPAHDGYNALSKKVYEGWKWAGALDVDYVFKTDDDMFLRMDVLAREFLELGRRQEYWRGFAYWNIPAITDSTNKNADFNYEMSSFPPYTAGALVILSHDLVSLVAPPTGSRLFVQNEDQALGLWMYPSGIRPIHDRRIQQTQVCENDMIAKHFGGQYIEEGEIGPLEMLANVRAGRKLCDGFLQRWCGVCYPSCRSRDIHWRDWGFACDSIKGATLSKQPSSKAYTENPVKALPEAFVIGSTDDPWIIPGLLSRYTSTFSSTDDWHLLHMLCWTTGPETFQERHYQAFETIWVHEPRAILIIMSTALPLDFFDTYTKHGYAIHVVRVGKEEMLKMGWFLGPQSEKWLQEWDRWSRGINFNFHLSDYLRYVFLFKYGGTYLDMDAPWVRSPPDSNLEFIGGDYATLPSDLDWTLDEDGLYVAPGVMRFKKGWILFRDVVEQTFSVAKYKGDCFNCVGPRAITGGIKSRRRQLELNGLTILPNDILYPKNWITAAELVQPLAPGQAKIELAKMVATSWSIHLFGKMTNHLRIQPESIMAELFDTFSLRIPRRAGCLSSAAEKDLGEPQGLGGGIELRLPSSYIYRSRQILREEEVQNLPYLGSLDGRFEGLDLIYIRGTKEAKVARAEVVVTAKLGRVAYGSSSARVVGIAGNREGEGGSGKVLRVELVDATLKDVNVLLGSLVYLPANGGFDAVTIRVEFGLEVAEGVVSISF